MADRRNPQERLAQGNLLASEGRHGEAAQIFRGLIRDHPQIAELHFNLANALKGGGDIAGAERAFEKSIALKPALAEAHFNLANLRRDLGRHGHAADGYAAVLRLDDCHTGALANAASLILASDAAAAASLLRRALTLAPQFHSAATLLGSAMGITGDLAAGICWLQRATVLAPDQPDSWSTLGDALQVSGRFEAAEACRRRALALDPGNAELLTNLGMVLFERQRPDLAIVQHRRALAVDAGMAPARWNHGLVSLALGDLQQGWSDYESRFAAGATPTRPFGIPLWAGDPLAGRRLLVWREQGIGDEIMWATCLPDLVKTADCVIECEPRLVSLFARAFPSATVRADTAPADRVGADGGRDHPQDADCHISIASLPLHFRPTLESFPAGAVLTADPRKVALWQDRLAALGPGRKVGLSWRSMRIRRQGQRSLNYCRLEEWRSLFDLPGIQVISLQYDDDPQERQGFPLALWPDLNLREDIDDVAALITALDGIVSVSNSVAALAGALGARTLEMAMAGGWAALGTSREPWFDSIECVWREAGDVSWDRQIETAVAKVRHWRDAPTPAP